ncbi:MAG: cobalamin biosynthesis protein [Candidatus Accumulibacter sp.]|jgi:cobalt-precorrin 5A hydrolase|nr:cobalamin biosynthesis protein [Accumulibacter sp.]
MRIAILAITRHGVALGARVGAALPGAKVYAPEKFSDLENSDGVEVLPYSGATGALLGRLFGEYDAIVAVFSIGALVRMVAPTLKNKAEDPALVVLDESGSFVIPVLSGHLGGANALALRLAAALGATPVLTTASDVRRTIGVDLLGHEFGWTLEASHDEIVRASAAMVNEEPIAFVQEEGRRDWWPGHAGGREGAPPSNLVFFSRLEDVREAEEAKKVDDSSRFSFVLWVSRRKMPEECTARFAGRCIVYRPRFTVALGVGCDRGTTCATLIEAVDAALAACGAKPADVAAVASIDLKSDEAALLEMAAARGWTIRFYPASELAAVDVPHPSEVVRRHTGTPSVSAAAALLAARADKASLVVEKIRRCGLDGRNATVSIARIEE